MNKNSKAKPKLKIKQKEAKKIAKITKDSNLAETIQRNPKSVEVFLKNGLHCIGCAVAHFETINEGATAHGLTDEQIERMVEELNNLQKSNSKKENKKSKPSAKKDVHEENFKTWRT
jgi:hybrid cluster-associated redox disulfide protein